ncbi:MAG: T9SS type A sorting domain-containing protein [Saprospiraceae bacterium]|nr:T9SS type A sorting domain-containing protein [Candidatus Vicinibacter affinis]
MAIKSDGTLWTWGNNSEGQLGDGTNISQNSPKQIGALKDWKNAIAGPLYTIAIKNDGSIWTWGRNDVGQLGDGTYSNRNIPMEINCKITTNTKSPTFKNNNLSIFPIPVQNFIVVNYIDVKNLTYTIRNTLGDEIVAQQNLINNQKIDLSSLVEGVYIISIGNNEGFVSKQFVKL